MKKTVNELSRMSDEKPLLKKWVKPELTLIKIETGTAKNAIEGSKAGPLGS